MDITAATPAPSHGLFARFDKGLGYVVEAAAAVIVVAELVLLGAATTARYVFNSPFTWSDELATILFVWLAVLGAVVALRRGEHMRLTAFVRNLSPAWRARGELQVVPIPTHRPMVRADHADLGARGKPSAQPNAGARNQ